MPTKKDVIKNVSNKHGPPDRNKMWKGLNFIETEYDDNEDEKYIKNKILLKK